MRQHGAGAWVQVQVSGLVPRRGYVTVSLDSRVYGTVGAILACIYLTMGILLVGGGV